MGKLIILLITIFPFYKMPALASWQPLKKGGDDGNVQSYIDFDNVWKDNGYIYYWTLLDYSKPEYETDTLSMKLYNRADCLSFKYEILVLLNYKKPMAQGKGQKDALKGGWYYPKKKSLLGRNLQSLCIITNIVK